MAPPMAGTHTALHLHQPIREQSCIRPYVPAGRARDFIYKGRGPSHAPPTNGHEQRGGACETAAELQGGLLQSSVGQQPSTTMTAGPGSPWETRAPSSQADGGGALGRC
ncbi:hypothetical protein AAFF_G00059940 [Aldrovandia affinis]|uniref:Uncharacterized protein n=1 Tax=Aldrovandia affinis TaxID=143900 RepID=A0AAD7WDV6_9TELE|nr:hypothetical protein AAFF_G00059940 [Aldrovandia affinis]